MDTLFLRDQQPTSRLIIIFLGWGCRPESFRNLRKPGYDILIVNDYRSYSRDNLELQINNLRSNEQLPPYREVVVVAWSFGVRLAADFLSYTSLNLSLCLAVNGSTHHIHDEFGIPERIFQGTLDGLSRESLRKFRLRTAGSKTAYEELLDYDETEQDFQALREELELFGKMAKQPAPQWIQLLYDKAIIGTDDRIFPPENLRKEWETIDTYHEKGMPHLPDFQMILDRYVVDKNKVEYRFRGVDSTYSQEAVVQKYAATGLIEKIAEIVPGCHTVFELGYGDGSLSRKYIPLLPEGAEVILCDIQESDTQKHELLKFASNYGVNIHFVQMDIEEAVSLIMTDRDRAGYDLIISSSTIQWLNSPGKFCRKAIDALAEGGTLALTFYGEGTLREISEITGNGLKYPSLDYLERVIEMDCKSENTRQYEETLQIDFPTPAEALRHLKGTGVNALPVETPPAAIRKLVQQWPKNSHGRCPLTFECKTLIVTV